MSIGDIFVKISKQEPLTRDEEDDLRLWGNSAQANNAVLDSWRRPGTPNPYFDIVNAKSVAFETPPLNASYYGYDTFAVSYPQDIVTETVTVLDDAFTQEIENPDSIIKYYDEGTGKFEVSPAFSKSGLRIFGATGCFQCETVVNAESYIHWRLKSDDSHYAYLNLANINSAGQQVFSRYQMLSDFDVSLDTLYFQVEFKHWRGSNMGVGPSVLFYRPI